ncbi:MAG: hypothetical protein K8S15_09275 [Candidatus Aegiribacteria sp.]|nr:hypothetical protein [Candidatus Aegiribacteria sp.]
MTVVFIILASAAFIPEQFIPVEGFIDLDNTATPARFGLLLVTGDDSTSNLQMAELILSSMDSLPAVASLDLYVISPDKSGYQEIALLCGEYSDLPSTLVMVGHCGYIELDPVFLTVEIIDAWYTWGSPGSRRTGICNFCRRCNPLIQEQ